MLRSELIRKAETIEVLVGNNTNATSFSFPQNNENIEKGYVYGLEAWNGNYVSVSPSGLPLIDFSIFQKAYLILAIDNAEDFFKIPLTTLCPALMAGIIRQFDGVKINFTKSKVVIPNATGLLAGTTFFFNFYYRSDKIEIK